MSNNRSLRPQTAFILLLSTLALTSCLNLEGPIRCPEGSLSLNYAAPTRDLAGNIVAVDMWNLDVEGNTGYEASYPLTVTKTARTYFPPEGQTIIPTDKWVDGEAKYLAGTSTYPERHSQERLDGDLLDSNETGLPDYLRLYILSNSYNPVTRELRVCFLQEGENIGGLSVEIVTPTSHSPEKGK